MKQDHEREHAGRYSDFILCLSSLDLHFSETLQTLEESLVFVCKLHLHFNRQQTGLLRHPHQYTAAMNNSYKLSCFHIIQMNAVLSFLLPFTESDFVKICPGTTDRKTA